MYEGLVLAILLYGSECWVLTEALRQRLHVFHAQCLRTMCRVTRVKVREESISTKALADEMGIKPIDTYIYRRQARWLGHVARMPFERLPRKMFSSWVAAPRLQGGQLMTYGRSIFKALEHFAINKTTWHELAQDRPAWRGAINGALLNAKRPKRAAAVETNRRMDAMIADGHALMSNASILASHKRAAEKPLGTEEMAWWCLHSSWWTSTPRRFDQRLRCECVNGAISNLLLCAMSPHFGSAITTRECGVTVTVGPNRPRL